MNHLNEVGPRGGGVREKEKVMRKNILEQARALETKIQSLGITPKLEEELKCFHFQLEVFIENFVSIIQDLERTKARYEAECGELCLMRNLFSQLKGEKKDDLTS